MVKDLAVEGSGLDYWCRFQGFALEFRVSCRKVTFRVWVQALVGKRLGAQGVECTQQSIQRLASAGKLVSH